VQDSYMCEGGNVTKEFHVDTGKTWNTRTLGHPISIPIPACEAGT